MALTQHGEQRIAALNAQLDELSVKRDEMLATLSEIQAEMDWIREGINRIRAAAGVPAAPAKPAVARPPKPVASPGAQVGADKKRMGLNIMGLPPYRVRVIEYLRTITEPQLAPEVTRRMQELGLITDYEKEKPAVTNALKRLYYDEEATRDDNGYRLADALRVPAESNGHP